MRRINSLSSYRDSVLWIIISGFDGAEMKLVNVISDPHRREYFSITYERVYQLLSARPRVGNLKGTSNDTETSLIPRRYLDTGASRSYRPRNCKIF